MSLTKAETDKPSFIAAELRSFIERLERLAEEKAAIGEDAKQVFAEAESRGFNRKAIRIVLGLRKLEPDERDEQETLVDVYLRALGMKKP